MATSNNYYDILGVSKDANDTEIKKQYKKLAMKYHPDRNKGDESLKSKNADKFKEISKAYTVLSDSGKRKQYDMFGEEGIQNMGDGISPFDMFSNLFNGGMGGMGGMGGIGCMGGIGGLIGHSRKKADNSNKSSPSSDAKLTVSLQDAYKGVNVEKSLPRIEMCPDCLGKGTLEPNGIQSCRICDGKGHTIQMKRMGPMVTQSVSPCYACNGKCKIIKKGLECKKCNGNKCVSIIRNYNIKIMPGSIDGDEIKFVGESDWVEGYGSHGDLIFKLDLHIGNSNMKREGFNLVINKTISLVDSLCGIDFCIKHLDDRVIRIKYDGIIRDGDTLLVKGEGMPISKERSKTHNIDTSILNGDLVMRFKLLYPDELKKEQKEYLRKIIPSIKSNDPRNINILPEHINTLKENNIKIEENHTIILEKNIYNNSNNKTRNKTRNNIGDNMDFNNIHINNGLPEGVQECNQM